MRKLLAILTLSMFATTANASKTDLNLILDVTYAQDGKESAQDAIVGLELYNKTYGSLTIGIGYEQQKADFFGEINKKSNQGLYIRYQGLKKIKTF